LADKSKDRRENLPNRKPAVKALNTSKSAHAKFERVFEKIYRMVLRIPRGRVMTYGQIARLLEDRYSPRLIGWAMHATPDDGRSIPWHRVINSRGGISTGRLLLHEPELQRLLLEAEGVVFDERGHCDLQVYQWSPRERQTRKKLAEARPSKLSHRGEGSGKIRALMGTATKAKRTKKR
jgi:methylated-DNA-protein-cysteine methyltransferase-like protein